MNSPDSLSQRAKIAASALLVVGLGLTAWGLGQIGWPVQGLNNLLWITLFAAMALAVLWFGLSPATATTLLGAGILVVTAQFWPMLVVCWFAVVSMLVGAWLLERLGLFDAAAQPLIAFLTGTGTLGTLTGLLAHWPINYPGLYATLLALPLALGRRQLVRLARQARDAWRGGAVQQSLGQRWLEVAIGVVALVHFVVAFLPELGYDALAMHLFVAEALRTRHVWGYDVDTYVWAVLPLLVDWTYAAVNMLGGETSARLLNVGFVFVIAWQVRQLVCWAGGTLMGERWAVLLFLVTPLTFTESNALFIEGGWTAFLIAGILAMLRALDGSSNPRSALPLAGLLCGFALASKAVTLPYLSALLVVMLARPSAWLQPPNTRYLAKAIAFGTVVGAVPYLTAWIIAKNPVFPFFNAIFKSPFYFPENFRPPPFERHLKWDSIYRVTFDSIHYLEGSKGSAGFQWLLLLVPCAVALLMHRQVRWRAAALLAIGALGIAAVFQQTAYLRYVFPSLAILLAAIGVGIGLLSVEDRGRVLWPVVAAGVVLLNILHFHTGTSIPDFPLSAAVSQNARDALVAIRHPLRSLVPTINALNGGEAPVVWVAESQATGLIADPLYPQWYNFRFMNEFSAVKTEAEMVQLMARRGSHYAVVDPTYQFARNYPGPIAMLLRVTDEITSVEGVSLRRLRPSLAFAREIAASPDFSDGAQWSQVTGASYNAAAKVVIVTPNAGVFQRVPVTPGHRYLNTITARCDGPGTSGRLQINWHDADARFVSVSSRAYTCIAAWTTHTMEVVAPREAVFAILYTSGNAGGSVMISLNSLKTTP